MDDETAKQRLDALLATAEDVKDLAEFFYKHHPTPEELQAVHNEEASREIEKRCRTLVEALRVLLDRGMTRYKDRTFSIIWQTLIDDRSATTEAAIYPLLQNGLALLAMHRRRLIDWQSAQAKKGEMLLSKKAKLLEYMLWIVQGRKDEDSPLETGVCKLLEKGTNCPSLLHTTRANRIDGDCVRCGKPGSRLRCRNCKICVKKGKDEYQVFGIYYCTLECHVADQERHEQTCKGVVALHRGAEMFTKLYVLTLQHCHEKVLTDIYSQGSVVTAKYGTLDERGYLGSPLFAEFPSGGSLGSAEVTLAVLTHGHCREVFITGRLLFEMLMRLASARIEEVLIQPKNMHKTVLQVEDGRVEFSALYRHHPLRITLPCGLQFAFDPTASQYGWVEILAPWDDYLECRAHHGVYDVITMKPMELKADGVEALAIPRQPISYNMPLRQAVEFFRRGVLEHVACGINMVGAECLTVCPENVVPVLLIWIQDKDFVPVMEHLYSRLKRIITEYLGASQMRKTHRMFLDFDMQPRLSQLEKTTQQLQKVWFSAQEYNSYKSDESKRRAYMRRLRKTFKNRQIGG